MIIFVLIFIAAVIASIIMQCRSQKRALLDRAFAFLSSTGMYFFLFMVCVTVFYCVKEPNYQGIRELSLTFLVPISLNLVILSVLCPVVIKSLPRKISEYVYSCFQNANYISILMFALWSLLTISADDDRIVFYGTVGAYFYNDKLLLLNFLVFLSTSAILTLFTKINNKRINAFFYYSNRTVYIALIISLAAVAVAVPNGLWKLKQSYSFAMNTLILSCLVTAVVSVVLCIIKKNNISLLDSVERDTEANQDSNNNNTDHRSFGKKFLIGLFPAILFAAQIIVLKPFEIFLLNQREFDFALNDFSVLFVVTACATAAGISAIIALTKGKVYDVCVSMLFAAGIAIWIQASFLNPELGVLDGAKAGLNDNIGQLIGNLAVWIAVFVCSYLLVRFLPQWNEIVSIVSVGLVAIQIFSLVTLPSKKNANSSSTVNNGTTKEISLKYYVDNKDQFTLSPVENTVVIILDCCSSSLIDDMLEVYPDALDFMTDFTYYDNYEPGYYKTYPSMTHFLTGNPLDLTLSVAENFKTSWNSSSADYFYSTLHDSGYKTFLYGYTEGEKTIYGELGQIFGKIDNVIQGEEPASDKIINLKELLRRFVRLSAYICLPNISKQYYFITTDDLTSVTSSSNIPILREFEYYDCLKNTGLTLANEETSKYLVIQHLASLFALPLNEHCEESAHNTAAQTAKGCMVLLEEYVKQLKELGIYDNTNIIVTADHGGLYAHTQCIFFIKEKWKKNDQLTVSHAPVSSNELLATILYDSGLNPDAIGMTIYDIDESLPRERTHISTSRNSSYLDVMKYNSNTNANNNEYVCYTYSGDRTAIEELVITGQCTSIPMVDSYE